MSEHKRREQGTLFIYNFTEEEMVKILVAHLRSEHWEMPHPDEVLDSHITLDRGKLTLKVEQKKLPEARTKYVPLRQFDPPPKPKKPENPNMIDISQLTAEQILDIAIKVNEDKKAEAAKPTPKIFPIADRYETPFANLSTATQQDMRREVIDAALKKAQAFSTTELMEELEIPNNHTTYQRIYSWLERAAANGQLKKKRRVIPGMKTKTQWVFEARTK